MTNQSGFIRYNYSKEGLYTTHARALSTNQRHGIYDEFFVVICTLCLPLETECPEPGHLVLH